MLQVDDFKDAMNFIAPLDIVPLLDPIGIVRGLKNDNVHYMPTSGCPVVDHYYKNNAYTNYGARRGAYYCEKFGVNQ